MVYRPLAITVLGLTVLWATHSGLKAMQARAQARRCEENLRHLAWRFEVKRQELGSRAFAAGTPPVAAPTTRTDLVGQGPPALGGAVMGSATIGVPIPEASPQATRRFLISRLRQTASDQKVRVEELRIGATVPSGATRVRPVTLCLKGKRDALQKVLFALRADPVVQSMKVTRSAGKHSAMKVTLNGHILAAVPPTAP